MGPQKEETRMRLFAVIVSLVVALSGHAIAQSSDLEISPEIRTHIRVHMAKERVLPVRVRERVDVGDILPEEVALRTVPLDWGPWSSRYQYVYSADGKVYLVEPSTRRVVRSIDLGNHGSPPRS